MKIKIAFAFFAFVAFGFIARASSTSPIPIDLEITCCTPTFPSLETADDLQQQTGGIFRVIEFNPEHTLACFAQAMYTVNPDFEECALAASTAPPFIPTFAPYIYEPPPPTEPNPPPHHHHETPEPNMLMVLGSGFSAIIFLAWRKSRRTTI